MKVATLILLTAIAVVSCSKKVTNSGGDFRADIQRMSGLSIPQEWKCEATDNGVGLFSVEIWAPPEALLQFCTSNHIAETKASDSNEWLGVKKSDTMFTASKNSPDKWHWEFQANPAKGKAIFIRIGTDKSGN